MKVVLLAGEFGTRISEKSRFKSKPLAQNHVHLYPDCNYSESVGYTRGLIEAYRLGKCAGAAFVYNTRQKAQREYRKKLGERTTLDFCYKFWGLRMRQRSKYETYYYRG